MPGNLCELLNGKFYSRPLLEWQLKEADWGGGDHRAEFVCRELDKVNGLLNRRRAPNSLIKAISGPCPRQR